MSMYSPGLIAAWSIAASEAVAGRSPEIEPAHLFLGLCKLCDLEQSQIERIVKPPDERTRLILAAEVTSLCQIFSKVNFDSTAFRRRLRTAATLSIQTSQMSTGQVMHRSQATKEIFSRAEELAANELSKSYIGTMSLIQALLEQSDAQSDNVFQELKIEGMKKELLAVISEENRKHPEHAARPTPYLTEFGRNLTSAAEDGQLDPIIGRREEMRTLARVLTQKRKRNALLVGEPGVGKTAVVEGLAQRLVGENAPAALKNRQIIEISISQIVAGTKYRGEFEERLQALLEEATNREDMILFIDEIHTILGAGGEGASDAANILKPVLARGEFQCIGATTTAEYRRYIEKDPALERRFQLVWIDEPGRQEALEVLRGLRPRFESHHQVTIRDDALEAAVDLSMRYLQDFRLPDKAIDLIDQACANSRITTLSAPSDPDIQSEIGEHEIAYVVALRAKVPMERLTQDEQERLLRMGDVLRETVIGQDEAVEAVTAAVRTARSGLRDPRRPVGTFLFAGSTGTGKTELAKTLTRFLFDNERNMVRIDMSEFQEKHTVSRLIGAPPGYLGYEEEGQLTGPMRTNPFSVVLFDEIEKAHPDVLNLFLQILDEGHLTDSHGRRVSFSEAIIILTTNLGGHEELRYKSMGFPGSGQIDVESPQFREDYRRSIENVVSRELKPELLNRIQRIVFFYPLGKQTIRQIIDKILNQLRRRLLTRSIDLTVNDAAYEFLIEKGFDPLFGAREMERAVERFLVQPLGQALVENQILDGAALLVEAHDGELILMDNQRTNAVHLSGLIR